MLYNDEDVREFLLVIIMVWYRRILVDQIILIGGFRNGGGLESIKEFRRFRWIQECWWNRIDLRILMCWWDKYIRGLGSVGGFRKYCRYMLMDLEIIGLYWI